MSEAPHTVKSYEEELKNLKANIVKMGSACEDALGKAIQAITTRNSDIAENVIQDDEKIDKYEALIEQQVVNLIALRQPMAIDLRETVTALKMSSDLERIGDLAKNISKRTLLLNENLPKNLVDSLNRVSTNVQKQLKSTLDAYLERSAPMAVNVWEGDEQIDDLTNLCMQEVIKYLKEEPNTAPKISAMYEFILKENVLFNNPKVILTPHIAASTSEASIVVAEMAANQVSDFLLDGTSIHTV